MALPKSKYSDPLHTPGSEFTLNGKDYIGWYVKTYQNKFYTGKVLNGSSKQIHPIVVKKLPTPVFTEESVQPDVYAREKGIWKRYFLQKKSNLKIIEVTKQKFDQLKNSTEYNNGVLNWVVKAPAKDVHKGPYTYYGAETQNIKSTKELEKTIPSLSSFIKDYSEFVE